MFNKFIFCISSLFIVSLFGMEKEVDIENEVRVEAIVLIFLCEKCDYAASQRTTLDKHMRIHAGE